MVTPTDPNQAQAWMSGIAPDQTVDFYIPRGNTGPTGPTGPRGPSVVVGSIETNMGPAAPGTVGATGLTGAKGDPGGFTTGTLLGTANLNIITTPGMYRTTSGTNTTLANNYPVNNNGGVLMVTEMSTGYVIQTYESMTGVNTSSYFMYKRQLANSVWTPWRAFTGARVDQTAGRAIYQWDDVNNREQLIYGDTGTRQVDVWVNSALFDNTGVSRTITARRVGNVVSMSGQMLSNAAVASGSTLFTLPLGFRQDRMLESSGLHTSSGNPFRLVVGNGSYAVSLWKYTNAAFTYDAAQVVQFSLMFSTTDPWPTTLPGIASGSIPNL